MGFRKIASYAGAAALLLASPFVGMFVGRVYYFAILWASRAAGFTIDPDPAIQAQGMVGALVGGFAGLACVALALWLILELTLGKDPSNGRE